MLPLALQQFLKDHGEIVTLHLHLDNDAVGRAAASQIQKALEGRYQVWDEPPTHGKDVNDQLCWMLARKKEEQER